MYSPMKINEKVLNQDKRKVVYMGRMIKSAFEDKAYRKHDYKIENSIVGH